MNYEFSVSPETRTIRGLAVPYGVIAHNNGRDWVFSKGTITWSDPSRVKLFMHHDPTTAIGVATELEDREDGLYAAFKVSQTPEGDSALRLAEDGVWDGLSIGIGNGGKFRTKDGISYAVDAPLVEISLTPIPAYSDARVLAVAASASVTSTGEIMENTNEAATLSADEVRNIVNEALAEFSMPAPETVSVETTSTQVREELPYRFNGTQGAHCFTADIKAAQTQADSEAAKRLDAFMGEAFANISTSSVSTVNPVDQRPELWVPNLHYSRPLWNMITTGTLSDITTQVLPKFGSANNLVNDHVQGTEPTEGYLSTANQTVVPGALSGKAILNREVVDQGGNPRVDQIVWSEMVAEYYRQLEVKIAAALNAVTTPEVNLETASATSNKALVKKMKSEFSKLQFVRGGDRFTAFAADDALYVPLVEAEDDQGRPLLPIHGPTNADGTTRASFESVQVGGKSVTPAWALAGLAAKKRSFLFVPSSVYAWASAPREFTFDYKVAQVEIGIWGYCATAVTRESDVIPFDMTTADA